MLRVSSLTHRVVGGGHVVLADERLGHGERMRQPHGAVVRVAGRQVFQQVLQQRQPQGHQRYSGAIERSGRARRGQSLTQHRYHS